MYQKEKMNFLVAGGIGVILGGTIVAVTTNAIPKMVEAKNN